MAQYEPIQPGLFRLQTPSGPLLVPSSEDELQAAGHTPLTAPGSGALALNDVPGAGGTGNVPQSRTDVPPPPMLGGPGSGGGGAPNLDAGGGAEGAPPVPVAGGAGAPLDPGDRPEGKPPKENGGTKERELTITLPGGGRSGGKPVDQLVGYRVDRSGLNPEDVNDTEAALGDASIDKKLSAQNVSDRKAAADLSQAEKIAKANREEEQAIAEQRARNDAMRAHFTELQSGIDKERADVDNLKVNPRQYIESQPGWARVLSAISILAGGAQGGLNRSGRNPALEALNQEVERNIDAQKNNIALRRQGLASRENELERLTKIYGSPEAAEAELRDRQRSLIQNYAVQQALESGGADAADNLRSQFADWDTERAKTRLGLKEALAGKVEETHRMAYPTGGGAAIPPKSRDAVAKIDAALAGINTQIALEKKHGSPLVLNSGAGGSDASQSIGAGIDALSPLLATGLEGKASPRTNESIRGHLESTSGERRMNALVKYKQSLLLNRQAAMQGGNPFAGSGGGEEGEQ